MIIIMMGMGLMAILLLLLLSSSLLLMFIVVLIKLVTYNYCFLISIVNLLPVVANQESTRKLTIQYLRKKMWISLDQQFHVDLKGTHCVRLCIVHDSWWEFRICVCVTAVDWRLQCLVVTSMLFKNLTSTSHWTAPTSDRYVPASGVSVTGISPASGVSFTVTEGRHYVMCTHC